ncbi:uncharacterized protein V3H82_013165 isoform 1-T1 [Fundulus diaphanus]
MPPAVDLGGIITEKLSAATREVLAAVERTVADYEEEAAGFRREIERQRRQLEVLQVKEPRGELLPDLQSHEEVVVGEEQDEQQLTQSTGVEAAESPGLPWNLSNKGAEPTTISKLNQEDPKDPHHEVSPSKRLDVSKSSSLRGIITEKLSAATTEVLEVVERTVADYEEEASGFRREIEQQRRQLEVLQPRVQDHKTELLPDLQSHEEVVVGEEQEEQQLTQSTGVDGIDTHCLPLSDDEAADDDDDEQPTKESRLKQEDPTDPDYEIPSRSLPSRAQSGGRRSGRTRTGEPPNHLTLRIRILEDSETRVLSRAVFQKSSVSDLECPRGLQELDFMDLLRSTFPQLAAGQPFDIFVATKNRQLLPLAVKTLTPEEICSGHRSGGNPTLYIRLKKTDDPPPADPVVTKRGQTGLHASPDQSMEEPETGENDADPGDDAKDGNWNPDPEPRAAKRTRKTREKGAARRTVESKMSCKVCGAWYRQLGSLISHVWNHVGDAQAVCGACGQKFESVDELKEHLRNHQKVHGCQHCGKTFVSAQSLSLHVAKHTGESQFKCRVCSKSFTNMASLNYHSWLHVEDKPHKCDVCLKSFGLESHLLSHKKLHTNKEKHVCDVCNRSFRLRRAMTQHRLTHSEDKQYACEICGKRFKLEGSLKVHSKTHAERDRTFLCHICCRTFLWKGTLMVHLKTHSNVKPFVCAVCSKGFWVKCDLKKHMRIHSDDAPYECSECGRRFKQKANLDSHVRLHLGIKQFVCEVCGKECSRREHLKVHMRTHNGDKPYKCTVCDRAFTQSHCLKTHMKSHQMEEISVLDPPQTHQTEENPVLDPSESHQMEESPALDPPQTQNMEESPVLEPHQSHQTQENSVLDPSEA